MIITNDCTSVHAKLRLRCTHSHTATMAKRYLAERVCEHIIIVVMDRACRDEAVGRAVERMWQRRMFHGTWTPSLNLDLKTLMYG